MKLTGAQTSGAERRSGFTFLELLIAMTILAIIAALAIPSMSTSDEIQVTSAARVIARDIESVQSLAITTQTPHTLLFNTDMQQYKVVADYDGISGFGLAQAIEDPVRLGALYQVTLSRLNGMGRVSVSRVDFGNDNYVTFDGIGVPSLGGEIGLTAGNEGATVEVEPLTGTVSVASN
ncbi:MAG: prepilin-type N-terminal cleavage/methylation domain-containing protein [Planctomycetia bacterium]|nr:prepilin-type N-terminal cleavage/methylation domain-containing protein [Planctomycetia bacterium]